MKNFNRTLLLIFLSISCLLKAQESQKISPELAAKAIKAEMFFSGVQIKSVGSGTDIMLEGSLPSQEAVDNLLQMANKYSDNIFNLVTVSPVSYDHDLSFYTIRKAADDLSSNRLVKTLCEGSGKTESFFILLSNENEKDELLRGSKDFLNLAKIAVNKSSTSSPVSFFTSNIFSFSVKSEETGTGFIKTKLKVYNKNESLGSPAFSKTYFSKPGEYIVVSGFHLEIEKSTLNSVNSLLVIHPVRRNQ